MVNVGDEDAGRDGVTAVEQGLVLADPSAGGLASQTLKARRGVPVGRHTDNVAVVPRPVEICPGCGQAQAMAVAFARGTSGLDRIVGSSFLAGLEVDPGLQVKISFAAKVVIERADAGTSQLDDVDDAGIPVTAIGEQTLGGLQQGAAGCRRLLHVGLIT